MKEYLLVIITTLVLAWVRERTYVGSLHSLGTRNKDRLCMLLIFLVLTLFLGLRRYYNDTDVYRAVYERAVGFPEFWETFSSALGDNPGFTIVQAWMKTVEIDSQSFLLLFTALSLGCTVYFLSTYSTNLVLTLFLFFTTNAYTLSAAAIKQSAAIALGMVAVSLWLKKRQILFVCTLLLAASFHPYVLMYALVPFLTFRPWSGKTYIMLAVFLAAGVALESMLGVIVDVTTMIGDSYAEEDFIGSGINIFRVLVANVVLVLTFLYRKQLFRSSTRAENLMVNLAMLNGAIMFVGLFGTAIYFSRMASYFTFAQCLALPWVLSKLPSGRKTFYTLGMVAGYMGFFVYANMISQSFTYNFSRMSLLEYVGQLGGR